MQPPRIDVELAMALEQRGGTVATGLTSAMIPAHRAAIRETDIHALICGRDVRLESHSARGTDGNPISITVLRPSLDRPSAGGVFYIHGGGMISGDRYTGIEFLIDIVEAHHVTAASVEYRLAPEHPYPAPVMDCYAGLEWFSDATTDLQFDRSRVVVFGGSAGGGLAAAVTLMARDKAGPPIRALLLIGPMLDDRNHTNSAHQMDGIGVWDRKSNQTGWRALLGDKAGQEGISPYAAPGRADDLADLPPTFIEVGSVEVFRDEAIIFASRIWAAGGDAELHVWAGGYHGFQGIAPRARLSVASQAARDGWLRRQLAQDKRTEP